MRIRAPLSERLGEDLLSALLRREDRIGALSIYCSGRAAGPEDGLGAARELIALEVARLRVRGHREVAAAAAAAGERLVRAFERSPELAGAGGHALFTGLSGDWSLHQPMPARAASLAAIGRRPFVRPLIAALEDGRPAGAVVVGPRAVGCHEWGMGEITELLAAERASERSLVERVGQLAAERGWSEIVLAGAPRLTAAFEALATPRLIVADVDGALDGSTGADLAAAIGRELAPLRASARATAVAGAVEWAAAGGPGVAVGAADVLAALRQEQVATFMFDNDRALSGVWLPDGRLARSMPASAACAARPEPMLLERMIERAIAGRARLVPLRGGEAEPLSAVEGVAAVLRW